MKMSCSILEHSFHKTTPTKLLKLVLMSKSINELQNRAIIYLISSPVPFQTISKTSTPIPPTFSHSQATIKIDLDLSLKFRGMVIFITPKSKHTKKLS